MEALLNESENNKQANAFEKMLAESRLDDLSMQRTVVGAGMQLKGMSHSSGIDSIKEVKHLYTAEETNVTKIANRIKKDCEVLRKKEKKLGLSNMENIEEFINQREGHQDYTATIGDVFMIQEEARGTLMDFLASPEADQELEEINSRSNSKLNDDTFIPTSPEMTKVIEEKTSDINSKRRNSRFIDEADKAKKVHKAKDLFVKGNSKHRYEAKRSQKSKSDKNKGAKDTVPKLFNHAKTFKGKREKTQTTRYETFRSHPTVNEEGQ